MVLWSATGCELVIPSNPFDPETDPARQAPAQLSGSVTVADGRDPIGAEVVVLHAGVDDVVAPVNDDGSYTVDVRAGGSVVSARMLGFRSAAVPITVVPGDALVVDLQLVADAPTSKVRGTVTAEAPLSASGANVSLLELRPDGDDCAAAVARAVADAAGDYVFGAVRPGRYRVFAASAGGVTALSDVLEVAEDDDVTAAALDIEAIDDGVALEVDGVVVSATSADAVDVSVAPQPGLEQLRIGLSPTFDPQQGSTGIIPYDDLTSLDLPVVDGAATVFVQLLGSCGESPVYEVPLVVDRTPPLLLSATLNGVALSAGREPTVVLRDAAASARLQLAGLDESGLQRIVAEGDITAALDVSTGAGQFVAAVDVAVPAAEGSYRVTFRVIDLAGNVTIADDAFGAIVVRDLEAPRVPIATATAVETFGPRATLWLDLRSDCPAGTEPFSCEAVPPEGPLFEIRGGVFTDFTPIAGPPFVVTVAPDVVTRFEIRAKDAAQNVSAANAIVDVRRPTTRERFRLPADRQFGMPVLGASAREEARKFPNPPRPLPVPRKNLDEPESPTLTVTGGTAFFSVRPTPDVLHQAAYSVLVAQPADLPALGLKTSVSPFPRGIRRLTYDPQTPALRRTYVRVAGALGGDAGKLTWLETTTDDGNTGIFARQMVVGLDGDARFDVVGADRIFPSKNVDDEGEPTVTQTTEIRVNGLPLPHRDLCTRAGDIACVRDRFRWRGFLDSAPPSVSGMRGQRVAVAGLSHINLRHHDPAVAADVRSQAGDAAGFRFIGGALVRGPSNLSTIGTVDMDITLPTGTPMRTAIYTIDGVTFEHETGEDDFATEGLTAVAVGQGRERIVIDDFAFGARRGEQFLVGILIPADVDFVFPTDDPAGLPTTLEEFDAAPDGIINHVVPTLNDAGRLPASLTVDRTGFPRLTFQRARVTTAGAPVVSGIVVSDLGRNRTPDELAVRSDEFAANSAALADERHVVIPVAAPGVQSTVTASADENILPESDESCIAIVRPLRDAPLESVTIDGAGILDDLFIRIFRSIDRRDNGIFERDLNDFGSTLFFDPEGGGECETEVQGSRVDETTQLSVTNRQVTFEDTVNVRVPALDSVDIDYNVEADVEELMLTRPVVPGTQLQVFTEEDDDNFGDADLRIVFNDPSGSEFFAELTGDENRILEVPEGATEVQIFLLAFDFGLGDAAVGVLGYRTTGDLEQIAEFPIPPGTERVSVFTFGDNGSFVGTRARFNAAPTADTFDCGGIEENDCELEVPPGSTSLFVAGELFVFESRAGERIFAGVTMDANFQDIEVGRFEIAAGESARVSAPSVASGGPSLAIVFNDQDGNEIEDCSDSGVELLCEEKNLEQPLTMVVSVRRGSVPVDLDLRVEIFEPGCSRAIAEADAFQPSILRAGEVYAIVVTGGSTWPTTNPRIAFGEPVDDNAAADLRVVGTTRSLAVISQNLVAIPGIDQNEPRCRVSVNLQRRVAVTQPTVGVSVAAAVVLDNGAAQLAIADINVLNPALDVVYDVEDGDTILALAVDDDDDVRFVERAGAGQLRFSARSGDVANDDLCVAFEEAFVPTAASFVDNGTGVVVGGIGVVGPVIRRYRLGSDKCASPILEVEHVVGAAPNAIAGEGNDIFFIAGIDANDNGGALIHINTASVELLAPAGQREVVGASQRSGGQATAIGFAPRLGSAGGLVIASENAVATVLSEGPASFQPVFVETDDGAVVVSVDGTAAQDARPSIVARDAEGNGSALLAASTVAAAPGFDIIDGRRFARDPILASSGDRVAVLGYANNGDRTLDVLTMLGTSEVARRSFPETLPSGAQSLELAGDIVVVGFEGAPRAYLIGDTELSEIGVADDERIVGIAGATLMVGLFPGDLFQAKPPTSMRVVRRDPRGLESDIDLDEAMPATLYGRAFARVVDEGDQVQLLDALASPPVVWSMRPSRPAIPKDGALRPLASSAPRLGRSSLSPGLAVRETAGGAGLYRVGQ